MSGESAAESRLQHQLPNVVEQPFLFVEVENAVLKSFFSALLQIKTKLTY